jgi:hypothetical protein
MANNYRLFVSALALLFLASVPAANGAQYDTPGIGSLIQGQAKVAVVVGAAGSGAPAGFTIQWMDYSDFLANGSQWPDDVDPLRSDADFNGVPTLNTWDGTLEDFSLDPWESAVVEIGDLFDETGVDTDSPSELYVNTTYIFRVRANGDATNDPSPFSPDMLATTEMSMNCTFSQGFWKNHPDLWPVGALTLGTLTYDQSELLSILTEPARGNGLIIIAHQLIAAELNIAQGADPSDVDTVLDDSHTLIGSQVVPPVGSGDIHPGTSSPLTQVLDDYNNGLIGPGYCGPVANENVSWGDLKAAYR